MHELTDPIPDASPRRHLLGWSGPLLPMAADWLLERHGGDLSALILVTPTRRAGRRLEALFLERRAAIARPKLITVGELPGVLVDAAGLTDTVAPDLVCQLARLWALQRVHEAKPDVFRGLVPDPPKADDLRAWQSLTRRLGQLRHELAAGLKEIGDVAQYLEGDARRWETLQVIEQVYEAALDDLGYRDPYTARRQAVETGPPLTAGVVLIGCADLTPLQRAAVGRMAEVDALIFAPDEHADRFDDCGGLLVESWLHEALPVNDASLRIVDQHQDQPAAAVERLAMHAQGLSEDDAAIGLGDESQQDAVTRAVERAGGRVSSGVGRPLLITGPCLFLQAAAAYLAGHRLTGLAEWVRHPDVDQWLRQKYAQDGSVASIADVDRYAGETLQQSLFDPPKESQGRGESLQATADRLESLFVSAGEAFEPMSPQPLPAWSESMLLALERLYANRELHPFKPEENAVIEALTRLGGFLRDQASLALPEDFLPGVTLPQAIDWTLARLAQATAADPPERGAIELMGLMDLYADDAPVAVITAVNEGYLPKHQKKGSDPFLPDGLRQRLGLPGASHRVAADNFMLHAIAHSKRSLSLIAARTSDAGDPLPPSRLLLQGPAEEAARRLKAFYSDQAAPPIRPIKERDPEIGNASVSFGPPLPERQAEPLSRLSVTAFRDYLACPYRFYLKRVLKLDTLDDRARELDAAAFGNLIHDTLGAFGQRDDAPRSSTDAKTIADYFDDTLADLLRDRYGVNPRAAVRVQAAFTRERLARFAGLQAAWAEDGWRIESVEQDFERMFENPSGEELAMIVHGRIDRIDHHPEFGHRVIDYKTSDAGKPPDKTHYRLAKADGITEWLDLQLPLYRDLLLGGRPVGCAEAQQFSPSDAEKHGVELLGPGPAYRADALTLGYVLLPRKPDDVGFKPAEWDAETWQSAAIERDRVIAAVRAQSYWPPNDPPGYRDGLEGLCADQWPQRAAYLRTEAVQ